MANYERNFLALEFLIRPFSGMLKMGSGEKLRHYFAINKMDTICIAQRDKHISRNSNRIKPTIWFHLMRQVAIIYMWVVVTLVWFVLKYFVEASMLAQLCLSFLPYASLWNRHSSKIIMQFHGFNFVFSPPVLHQLNHNRIGSTLDYCPCPATGSS